MLPHAPSPNLRSQAPPPPPPRPLYLPNAPLPLQPQQSPVPPLPLNRQNVFPLSSALTPRPVSSVDPPQLRESQPVSQSQIVGNLSVPSSGRYSNKYSFKRNSTTRSKALSFANRDNSAAIAAVAQQEAILGRVRELAASRRGSIEAAASTAEGVTLWNTLTEIYNLALAGNSSQLQPLQPIVLQNRIQPPQEPPRQAGSKVGLRPTEVLQASKQVQFSQQLQAPVRLAGSLEKGEFLPVDLPSYSAVNNSSELYSLEIRELRNKIEALEQEKGVLHGRIRSLEQGGGFSGGQETVELYRAEINSLREQISQISQAYGSGDSHSQQAEVAELRTGIQQLSETVRQYEEQLLQAHSHICFLEQSRNKEAAAMQAEVRSLQRDMAEHAAQFKQREQREAALLQQIEDEKAKLQDCLVQLSSAQKAIKALQSQRGNQFEESSMSDKDYLSNLKEEVTRLNLQLNQAQLRSAELNEHLVKAEDYIVELQRSREVLLGQFEEELRVLREENGRLAAEVNILKDDLNTARAEAEILTARAATAASEYEDMECRYRQTVESLSARYDELLDERNSLISKLADAHPPSAAVGNEEADALRRSLQQLSAQVAESQEHLRTAELYIEENLQSWEAAAQLKQQHEQQQAFVAAIDTDLQNTRRQNLELARNIQEFERIVAETERLRAENEQLTIVIREKDNAPVATSLKQVDEVQAALDNYAFLYRESEARERQLLQEGAELRRENERVRGELAKIGQLEQYLARAENFIIEQEGKMNETIRSFEAENGQVKEHLFKAEEYILALQEAAEKQQQRLLEAEASRQAEKKRADELYETLVRAENFIYDMEAGRDKK